MAQRFDAKHAMDCYPPSIYSPYLLVFIGFVSSILITNIVMFYGALFFSKFILKMRKYCGYYKMHNNFQSFPQILKLSCPNPKYYRLFPQLYLVCGQYKMHINYDVEVPSYLHNESENCELRFHDGKWIVFNLKSSHDTIFNVRYEIMQNSLSNHYFKQRGLSITFTDNCLIEPTEISQALASLIPKQQCWRIVNHDKVTKTITKSELNFSVKYNDDNIILNGFNGVLMKEIYTQSEIINFNGKYITTQNPQNNLFIHEQNNLLSIRCINQSWLHYESGYNINHDRTGEIGYIPFTQDYIQLKEHHEFADIPINITSSTKTYYIMKIIATFMSLSILYQLYRDIYYFIMYYVNHSNYNGWNYYSCYAFIITNSSNLKQVAVYYICYVLNTEQYQSKMYKKTVVQKLIYYVLLCQLLLLLPICFTHEWALGLHWVMCCPLAYEIARYGLGKMDVYEKYFIVANIILMYIFILVSVPLVNWWYYGDSDIFIQSVNYRKVTYYIDYIEHKLQLIEQLWLWIL
eukprot:379487_1